MAKLIVTFARGYAWAEIDLATFTREGARLLKQWLWEDQYKAVIEVPQEDKEVWIRALKFLASDKVMVFEVLDPDDISP